MSGELASERWSPAQRVESVLISILSLLDDAEVSSPANVDAAVMLRKEPDRYREIVRQNVEESKQDMPEGFVIPRHEEIMKQQRGQQQANNRLDDEDFWADSDVDVVDDDEEEEDVFGGSDSDEEMQDTTTEDDEEDDDEDDEDDKK